MKKIAFVLGYAGGILALICSLLMIYLVPVNFVSKAAEDIKSEMKNENVVALNEVAIYAGSHPEDPITDYSKEGLIAYADKVAKQNDLAISKVVYEDTMAFTYKTALDGIISAVLIGISIIFSLLAFIGSLAVRKHSTGGAVLMLVSALILLLCSIYTRTIIPMAAASVVLAAAGIFSFIPVRQLVPAEIHARNRQKPQRVKQAPYPQPQFQPGFVPYPQYPQQPIAQPQYTEPPAASAEAAPAPQAGIPFPEEDVQVFTQPNPDDIK